jgi:hypothetical protein
MHGVRKIEERLQDKKLYRSIFFSLSEKCPKIKNADVDVFNVFNVQMSVRPQVVKAGYGYATV